MWQTDITAGETGPIGTPWTSHPSTQWKLPAAGAAANAANECERTGLQRMAEKHRVAATTGSEAPLFSRVLLGA
jgi:hypothetical protein